MAGDNKKECPSCAMMIDADATECPICQYEFPKQTKLLKIGALVLALLLLYMFLR